MTGLAVVTVVFEPEVWLLRLQARSMARYLPPELVEEVVVIDNCRAPLDAATRQGLLADYGPLAGTVRVLRREDIAEVPPAVGWRTQQVLKLCVADQLTSERYVVLDAKNHFVAAPDRGFFEAPDGRPRVNTYSYRTHPLRPSLEHVLDYLGLDPEPYLDRFTATVTPFVLDTGTVRALVADVAARSGRSFGAEFVAQGLTEFFLVTGWGLARGATLDELVDDHQVFCPAVWPRGATLAGVQEALAQAAERGTPLLSVQRNALAALDRPAVEALAEFWAERGLVASAPQTVDEVLEFQRSYVREARATRRRELPRRVRAAVERRVRRLTRTLRRGR